jgi:glycosyltransferase involved in cell wall biosynthesis
MPVKILVMTSSYPTSEGTHEGGFIADLVRRLPERRILPFVLVPHFPGGVFKEQRDGIPIFCFPYFFPFRFERLAYGSGLVFNIRRDFFAFAGIIPFCKAEFLWTLALLYKEQVDLIHTHWLIPQGFTGAVVHWITGLPHVATVHGSDLALIRKSAILTRICSFIIRHSDAVTVNSSYTRQLLVSLVPGSEKKIQIIPMGVDPQKFIIEAGSCSVKKNATDRVILNVGRLIDWKGTQYLIDAMPEVLLHIPDARLIIIGTGPEEESLRQRARELQLDDHITFLGAVSNKILIEHYHCADVFILPSIQKSGNTEGLGVVLLEAMASGCPVIGSNVGGIPDIITDGENGFLVPERDSERLAEQIIRLLQDGDLRGMFRKNGYIKIHTSFSWDLISNQFASVYHQSLMDAGVK